MRQKLACLLLLCVLAIPVHAAAIRWDLVDVAFAGSGGGIGGTASGYFVATDHLYADCGGCLFYSVIDWNITVSGADDFAPFTYTPETAYFAYYYSPLDSGVWSLQILTDIQGPQRLRLARNAPVN